jgi:amidase
VQRLLAAGASLAGKTHTDELTYSLNGENYHYGTPVNPMAPGRIPGGSSSGSAAAVAGGLVDFALGTDTGGSVRLPASNCGIFGFRPSHGLIASDGVVALAPSFDTIGWFARDAGLLERIGAVLLQQPDGGGAAWRLLRANDAFELTFADMRAELDAAVASIETSLGPAGKVQLFSGHAEDWMMSFRLLQGAEALQVHGQWIENTQPEFGPEIRDRFEWAAKIDHQRLPGAQAVREQVRLHLDALLGQDGVLCIPTSPSIALPSNAAGVELEQFRSQALALLCVAGLAGLPQVSMPLAAFGSCPLGISLVGPGNSDARLLALAASLTRNHRPDAN